jgi:hypothetical protein
MFSTNTAEVLRVVSATEEFEELQVSLDGKGSKAINYIYLTGNAGVGDRVVLNTTAQELNLGSGGYHFVLWNHSRAGSTMEGPGHIMKLRYTPLQLRVLAVEEEQSPHHEVMKNALSLDGMPVAAAELHSMLAPIILSLKKEKPGARLAYLMTDGGALPAFFSRTVRELRERNLLCGTVTAGHAFGGDLEAVNIYSGLLAAKHVLRADITVVAMGPGVAGTGTPFGFSGLETADNLNRAVSLGGRAVMVPRISFADSRDRHYGLSHHTRTALVTATLTRADLPVPVLENDQSRVLETQLRKDKTEQKHNIYRYEGLSLTHLYREAHLCSTMGRSLDQDAAFFLAATAAAVHLGRLLDGTSAVGNG